MHSFFVGITRQQTKHCQLDGALKHVDSLCCFISSVLANLSLNATPDIMQLTPSEQNRIRPVAGLALVVSKTVISSPPIADLGNLKGLIKA